MMKAAIESRLHNLYQSLEDDNQRRKIQFFVVYLILALVSAFMTAVNVFTHKNLLMLATLLFTVMNLINLLLSIRVGVGRTIASVLFSVELTALFVYFIVSGEPEGFSAIWVCLLPASGMLLYGKKYGSALCAANFLILAFFFYLPFGRSLLRFGYTESFLLRFPMLYVAFFAVAFFLETIREATYHALLESRRQYKHLYSHDALTGLYNRYGFNEHMDSLLRQPNEHGIALMIVDIDNFKHVNDSYGHPVGDIVLKEIAALLVRESGEQAAACRWGGEEFAVILASAAGCGSIAQNALDAVRAVEVSAGDQTVRVTVSIGLVMSAPHITVDPAILVTQTDRCLYSAKDAGKDCIVQMPYDQQRRVSYKMQNRRG